MDSINKVLILAPHTDDGELGCGASIARFCREGKKVTYVAFSSCRRSLPKDWAPDTLELELKNATRILGIQPANLIILDYDVRHFPENRQLILEVLVKIRAQVQPDLVFIPSSYDIHQDHKTIHEEGLRAFKNNRLLGYEMPWNNLVFQTSMFINVEEPDLQTKIRALGEYKSQQFRSYINENFVRSLATTRGVQIGSNAAEAFEMIRWIL